MIARLLCRPALDGDVFGVRSMNNDGNSTSRRESSEKNFSKYHMCVQIKRKMRAEKAKQYNGQESG
jgi:hypothetical protein